MKKSLFILAMFFGIDVFVFSDDKNITLHFDESYLTNSNITSHPKKRNEFNKQVKKFNEKLRSQKHILQSEYEKEMIELFCKGLSSEGFSNNETNSFLEKLLIKEQKGIIAQAMEKAEISEGFAHWISSHEIEVQKLLVERLAAKFKSVKEKTPDEIRNAIKSTFDEKEISSTNNFFSGSLTTLIVCAAIWYIKTLF